MRTIGGWLRGRMVAAAASADAARWRSRDIGGAVQVL